ncbi:MAG: SOS response-associated peptidase [Halobacteriaceae archaeon]
MCGRYSIFTPPAELRRRFDVRVPDEVDLSPRYNAAPGQDLPVVLGEDPDRVAAARWGFTPAWADEERGHVNARAETLAEKPTFAAAYERRRCLVLADGFYEWADGRPYRVTVGDGAFAMAGVYERWTPPTEQAGLDSFGDGPAASGPDPVTTYAVVTTEPNEVVADLHHRMAVVLPEGAERRWLETGDPDLLGPAPAEATDRYPVSTAVDDVANDDPSLVRPVEGGPGG